MAEKRLSSKFPATTTQNAKQTNCSRCKFNGRCKNKLLFQIFSVVVSIVGAVYLFIYLFFAGFLWRATLSNFVVLRPEVLCLNVSTPCFNETPVVLIDATVLTPFQAVTVRLAFQGLLHIRQHLWSNTRN